MDLSLGSSPQQQPHPLAPRMRQRSVVLFSIVFSVVFVDVCVVVFVVVFVVVVVVVFVVFGVVFAGDISGLGRLVVLTVETRSQNLFRALAGGLGAAGGAVVEQPQPAEAGTAPTGAGAASTGVW